MQRPPRKSVLRDETDVKWICRALQQMEEWDTTGRRRGSGSYREVRPRDGSLEPGVRRPKVSERGL